jgi:glycosyltransferase involved in cell wall biosynthesis
LLESTLLLLLDKDGRTAVLLGRGGEVFCARLTMRYPEISGRVIAFGELPPSELAARLKGCDVLVQPYTDGISSRRSSAMAGLANGVPLVSNLGTLSESLWASADCIGLATSPSPRELCAATEAVLSLKPAERASMGQRAITFYRDHFGLEKVIDHLRNPPGGSAPEP